MENILTKSECATAVQNYLKEKDVTILNYSVEPYSKNIDGFVGDHFLIKAKVETATKKQICVRFFGKRFPQGDLLMAEYIKSVKAFENEIATYDYMFKEFEAAVPGFIQNFSPKMCFSRDSDLLIFEDLFVKGFTMAKRSATLFDLEHIQLVLQAQAKYHAGSLAYEEIKSRKLGHKVRIPDEINIDFVEYMYTKDENFLGYQWLRSGMRGLLGVHKTLADPKMSHKDFKEKLLTFFDETFDIMKTSTKFRNVVCHGDLWSNNAMFRYENNAPVEAKIIDFQLQHYIPPAQDVVHFIYESTNQQVRQYHFFSLLRFYYKCLQKELSRSMLDINKILPWKEFMESVFYFLPQVKLEVAMSHTLVGGSKEFRQTISSPENYKSFFFEDRSKLVTEFMQKDPTYKYVVSEMLGELEEYLSCPKLLREDCYQILENLTGTTYYDFKEYALIPLGGVSGYLGDYYKLKLLANLNGQDKTYNLFVKSMPISDAWEALATESGAFDRELYFFDQIVPAVENAGITLYQDCLPTCWYPRDKKFGVMADLIEMGYSSPVITGYKDADHLKVALGALAKFHASSLVFEETMSEIGGKPYRVNEHFDIKEVHWIRENRHAAAQQAWVGVDAVPFIIEQFPEVCTRSTVDDFKNTWYKSINGAYDRISASKKYRNAVCHGDTWISNLMFKYEHELPVDCRIVDFQLLRYCPPAHDILNLFFLCSNRETRMNNMPQLINHYYNELAHNMNGYGYDIRKVLPKKEFLESLEYMKIHACMQLLVYIPFIEGVNEITGEFFNDKELAHKVIYVDRIDLIKKIIKCSPKIKNRMRDTILDLYDAIM